jgi:hypothetical protein
MSSPAGPNGFPGRPNINTPHFEEEHFKHVSPADAARQAAGQPAYDEAALKAIKDMLAKNAGRGTRDQDLPHTLNMSPEQAAIIRDTLIGTGFLGAEPNKKGIRTINPDAKTPKEYDKDLYGRPCVPTRVWRKTGGLAVTQSVEVAVGMGPTRATRKGIGGIRKIREGMRQRKTEQAEAARIERERKYGKPGA